MATHAPGWAVEVTGNRFDLDDLRTLLPAPFDPWVEEDETPDGKKLLLRSASWNQLVAADLVHAQASPHMRFPCPLWGGSGRGLSPRARSSRTSQTNLSPHETTRPPARYRTAVRCEERES